MLITEADDAKIIGNLNILDSDIVSTAVTADQGGVPCDVGLRKKLIFNPVRKGVNHGKVRKKPDPYARKGEGVLILQRKEIGDGLSGGERLSDEPLVNTKAKAYVYQIKRRSNRRKRDQQKEAVRNRAAVKGYGDQGQNPQQQNDQAVS